jgi:hypothetical protein
MLTYSHLCFRDSLYSGDIARLISARFKTLGAKEKKTWDEKAAEDKIRYQAEMVDYRG